MDRTLQSYHDWKVGKEESAMKNFLHELSENIKGHIWMAFNTDCLERAYPDLTLTNYLCPQLSHNLRNVRKIAMYHSMPKHMFKKRSNWIEGKIFLHT